MQLMIAWHYRRDTARSGTVGARVPLQRCISLGMSGACKKQGRGDDEHHEVTYSIFPLFEISDHPPSPRTKNSVPSERRAGKMPENDVVRGYVKGKEH